MNTLLKSLFLWILIFRISPVAAQVMISAEYTSGENIARAKPSLLPDNAYTFSSQDYHCYRLCVYGWEQRTVNIGAAAHYMQTAFSIGHQQSNRVMAYQAGFAGIEPFLDGSVDRKRVLHLQLGLPLNFWMSGRKQWSELVWTGWSGNARPGRETADRDSFRKFVPQLALRITAAVPIIPGLRATGSAGYVVTLGRFTDMDDKHVHPAQIYLGLGIGFHTR